MEEHYMTIDDIIRMAKESDLWGEIYAMQRFAELVAAAEREACAALCFRMWNEWLDSSVGDDFLDTSNCPDAEDCAAAIRARGQE
jgi:hypothetical protein